MKIGVLSDSHSRHSALRGLIALGPIDMLFHLGDHCSDLSEEAVGKIPFYRVRGNCDFSGSIPYFLTLDLGGRRFFLTHGHLLGVKTGVGRLICKAKEIGADAVLFGHTHMPMQENEQGILLLNPGSVGLPRGGRPASAAILHIENGQIFPQILSIQG